MKLKFNSTGGGTGCIKGDGGTATKPAQNIRKPIL